MGAKELSKYSTVIRWGNRVKLARPYLWSLNSFIEWAKANDTRFSDATPDSLVEFQRSLDNGNKFELLDVVQNFINSLKGRASTKLTTYHQIRSFFAHNRTELPRDQGFIVNGDKLPVKGTLTSEDTRAILMSSNKMHKALYLSMFQG